MKSGHSKSLNSVLIVDDDPGMLLLIRMALAGDGFEFLTAGDGKKARSTIEKKSGQIAAILLDWEMPEMSGIDLLRWIKQQPQFEHIPVIMETAMDSPERVREGIEAGAFYYLTKPFDQEILHSIVSAAVDDFRFKKSLLTKLAKGENPFGSLVEGTFRFQTLSDGESIALWIANASTMPDKVMIISELITNAIEHGNLGITYDQKSAYVANGTWHAEIERRLTLPENADKFVTVRIERNAEALTVLVQDRGPGFGYQNFLEFDTSRVFDNHGRGIAMAKSSLNLRYLGNGNQVEVSIPFAIR